MNYHILAADSFGNSFQVAFHIPIPDQNNDVGYSYRSAIVEWQGGDVSSIVPFIEADELAQLKAGELYEVVRQFDSNPGETLLVKRDALDALYAVVSASVHGLRATMLQYWGYSRDVV